MLLPKYLKTETEKKERRKETNCAKPSALASWVLSEHSQKHKVSYLLQETAYKSKRAGDFFILFCFELPIVSQDYYSFYRSVKNANS